MAELQSEPYPTPSLDEYDDYAEMYEAEMDLVDELREDDDETVIRFPVADNYAIYRVSSWEPLTLQHVPTGDAYQIPRAHLRGLREEDVRAAEF